MSQEMKGETPSGTIGPHGPSLRLHDGDGDNDGGDRDGDGGGDEDNDDGGGDPLLPGFSRISSRITQNVAAAAARIARKTRTASWYDIGN